MEAAVIAAPGEVRVMRTPMPDPGPGQVRVRLQGCGVCGSHAPMWAGREWFSYPQEPGAPGHEGWGVVDAVGEGVTDIATGERVAVLSYKAFAGYDLVAERDLVRLPEQLSERPFPGEALGCAMNVFRRSRIRKGDSVAIIGIGFLGALLTQLASSAAARVVAVSRRPYSLDVAKACGAAETIPMDDHHAVIEQAKELTNGALFDRVIEAVGLQWPLDVAGELTAERGRLIVAGYHQDGLRTVNMQLWNWRGIDVINAHERDPAVYVQGMKEALRAIEQKRLDPFPLYTHMLELDQLGDGLNLLHERPDGFMKAVIRIHS